MRDLFDEIGIVTSAPVSRRELMRYAADKPARCANAAASEGLMSEIERESMEFDVVIVGAGPAGLAAAYRLARAGRRKRHPVAGGPDPGPGAGTLGGTLVLPDYAAS